MDKCKGVVVMAEESGLLDVNNLLAELVNKNVDNLIKGICKVGTDQYKKLRIKTGMAFEKYLTSGANKYGFTKTILYRDKIVPLRNFTA
jgi:hypothetical protein